MGVVVDSPALDQDLRFVQAVEDLAIQQLVPELCSVTPIFFTAVAIGWPWATITSTWRSSETISSGCSFACLTSLMEPQNSGRVPTWRSARCLSTRVAQQSLHRANSAGGSRGAL